jgi:hypothetical protein
MAAMVLVIGASVWSFATSASSIISTNYYEEVMESVEKVKERFAIENTGVDSDSNTLRIWLYNYGPIDLTIDLIRVTGGNNISSQSVSIPVSAGEIKQITVEPTEISLMRGLSVTIELRSSRGSKTYDSIRVP